VSLALLLAGCPRGAPPGVAPAPYDGPVYDVHVHVDAAGAPGDLGLGVPADLDAITTALDALPAGSRGGLVTIAPRGDLEQTRAQNDAVLAAAAAHPDRFWAVASVNPWDGDAALAEIDRVADAGARWIKLHPNTQQFDVGQEEVAAVVARAAERDVTLLFDGYSPFDADQLGKFLLLAARNPDARLVLAHLGGPRFSEVMLFASARRFPWYANNVWFDLSVVAELYADSPFEDELVFVCRRVGVDRVLFGSDFPVTTPERALDRVRALGFTTDEQRAILHDNAAALLAPR
jgi:predicted TIM-barrel fold metal-dependent hydrolase